MGRRLLMMKHHQGSHLAFIDVLIYARSEIIESVIS